MRRVVVTGLGLVTPLGSDVETVWKNLIAGESGAGPITHFDASDYKCQIACEVKSKDHAWGFDPDRRVDPKIQRQVDPFIIFGIDAAGQALEDAGLTDMSEEEKMRTGCWGDTIGLMRSKTIEGPWHERHPLQIIIPPQPADAFDSTWTGWPRVHVDETGGTALVLYAAGGRDMQNSTLHDYATTGIRTWSLDKLAQWDAK